MPPATPQVPEETANSTAANETASGGSGGGGGVLPDGWELLRGAMEGALQSIADGVQALLDAFNYHLLTLPAAGEATAPATWTGLDDPYWIAVATVYGMVSAFVLPLVWGVGWFNVGYPRGVARRERLKNVTLAVGFIVAGWPFLQLWLHFWNQAALAFAPSGAELLSTPGNTAKLGIGVALGFLLLLSKAIIVLAGLLIHAGFVLLTFVFVALWPLSVGLYLIDAPVVDAIGKASVTGTLMLSPLQFIKALVLRVLFELPLKVDEPATLMTFVLIVIGVFLAFVGIPYYGLKRLLPRTIVSAGRRQRQRRREHMDSLRDRAPSASELKDRVGATVSGAGSRLGRRGGGGDGSTLQSRTRSSSIDTRSNSRLTERADTRTRTMKQRLDDDD